MAEYIDYLRQYGPREDSHYRNVDQDFGQRLAALFQGAPEGVRRPGVIESLYRDTEGQGRAIRQVAARRGIPFTPMLLARGIPGYAAPVGGSLHQSGRAADLNWAALAPEARDWLRSNAGLYGLRFPLPGTDAGHIEMDPDWNGQLPTAAAAPVSGLPAAPPPIMDAAMIGLGARRADTAPSLPPIVQHGLQGFADGGRVAAALRIAAKQTDRHPTEAQKHAGNYAKGKFNWRGETIAIENPKGATRSGRDKDGKPWRVTLPAHYGYVLGSEARDGDHVDCYVGPDHDSDKVFIIDQIDAETKKYDEVKCLLDFASKEAALSTYRKAFSDGKADQRIGAVTEMSVPEFRAWLKSGSTKKPLGKFANGGTVAMPLMKSASREAVSKNIATERAAGKSKDQAIAIALNVARKHRADGGRIGYDGGGMVLDTVDLTPETERRAQLRPGPPPDELRSANTPLGDLLARYTGSVDVGRAASGIETFSRDFAGATDAELADRAFAQGDVWRGLGHTGLAFTAPLMASSRAMTAMGRAPVRTGLGYGLAGTLAAGGGDYLGDLFSSPAQAQTPADQMTALARQLEQAQAEVRRIRELREAQRPKGRTLDPDRDRNFYNLDNDLARAQKAEAAAAAAFSEAQRAAGERQALETQRERQRLQQEAERARRETPEFLERERRIGEARGARDRIRSEAPLPFRQEFGAVGERWPMAPLVVGATTGLAAALPGTIADRYATARWQNALTRAEGGQPMIDRLLGRPAIARNSLAAQEALDAAARYAQRTPAGGGWAPYVTAGGLGFVEGAALPNLQQYYDLVQQPPVNPERTAQEAYYRGLPEDHPDRPRTRALLEDEVALPRENPHRVGPERFYSSLEGLRTSAGAGLEGAASALAATTLGRAPRTQQSTRDWLRARTDALTASRPGQWPRPQGPSTPPASPGPAGGSPATPTPLRPMDPAPGPGAELPPAGGPAPASRQLAPPAAESGAATAASDSATRQLAGQRPAPEAAPSLPATSANSNDPQTLTRVRDSRGRTNLHNELGRFTENPRSMRQRRLRESKPPKTKDGNDEPGHKDGGLVSRALDIARRFMGGRAKSYDTGGAVGWTAVVRPELPPPQPRMPPYRPMNLDLPPPVLPSWRETVMPPRRFPMRDLPDASEPLRGIGPQPAYNSGGPVAEHGEGSVAGPVIGPTGGREDAKPVNVRSGSFVIPADVVAGLGKGNTFNGMQRLVEAFGPSDSRAMAAGGAAQDVPILISDGEFVVTPEQVAKLGGGDVDQGHRVLDKLVVKLRQQHIAELQKLPAPAKG